MCFWSKFPILCFSLPRATNPLFENVMRVKGSGDGSVSSDSAHGGRFRVAKGETPRCHCGAYAIVVESGTEKNPKRPFFGCPFYREKTPHCDFFVWFDRVFQCDGHGREDDDALAEKVKKLKELLDAFEKKNKNPVENRRWFECCSPVFFFILGFMVLGQAMNDE
ncbi:hypothetical protein HN51_063465 [Arachis hypogaea]